MVMQSLQALWHREYGRMSSNDFNNEHQCYTSMYTIAQISLFLLRVHNPPTNFSVKYRYRFWWSIIFFLNFSGLKFRAKRICK